MRTPEEKEKIITDCLNGNNSVKGASRDYDISRRLLITWIDKYREYGLEGLKSNSGKSKSRINGKPKTEIDELKLDLLKKEIEIMRLKKGYQAKGVGAQKEYVTIFDANMK